MRTASRLPSGGTSSGLAYVPVVCEAVEREESVVDVEFEGLGDAMGEVVVTVEQVGRVDGNGNLCRRSSGVG